LDGGNTGVDGPKYIAQGLTEIMNVFELVFNKEFDGHVA
jgi:hypothetical protein